MTHMWPTPQPPAAPAAAARRRLDVDADVYLQLDREARYLHITISKLATLMLQDGLAGAEILRSTSGQAADPPSRAVEVRDDT